MYIFNEYSCLAVFVPSLRSPPPPPSCGYINCEHAVQIRTGAYIPLQLCHHLALHICEGYCMLAITFSSKICRCVHVEYDMQLNALNVSDVKPPCYSSSSKVHACMHSYHCCHSVHEEIARIDMRSILPTLRLNPFKLIFLNSCSIKPHSSPCCLRYWSSNIVQQWCEELCITKILLCNEITIKSNVEVVSILIHLERLKICMGSWRFSWWAVTPTKNVVRPT